MKTAGIIIMALLLVQCDKNSGKGLDVRFRTVYTPSAGSDGLNKRGISPKTASSSYTLFGNLIGTITPRQVTASFNSIRFIDRNSSATGGMQTMVEVIGVNWAADDVRRFADYTNGSTAEAVPEMWGNVDNDGWFADENIILRYLGIFPAAFDFEFVLPDQFTGVWIDPANLERDGNSIRCDIDYLLSRISDEGFDYGQGVHLKGFVFGETDSTYIVTQDNMPDGDIAELISMAQPHAVARSGNYSCPVLTPPESGESKIITVTISFDAENIIQHFAGPDSTAYTFDDVFVLEPGFWDRFSILIDQN